MQKEIAALEANDTWEITDLPHGKKAIGSKWHYKVKFKPDGTIDKYKARFVVRGFTQVKDKDYKHTFSPVAKLPTVRVLIALAAINHWPLQQLDVNNAFLHGHLDEEVYILPPKGYVVPRGKVCRLKKSLYGLKQASRQWNLELTRFLKDLGFTQSKQDYSMFTRSHEDKFLAALVYVDDILLTGNDVDGIGSVKTALHEAFTIKDMGAARYFLGVEIARSNAGILLNQRKYILAILVDVGLSAYKPAAAPLPLGLHLSPDSSDILPNPAQYRRLVGRLLYLNLTRPDLTFVIRHLSQFLSQPRKPHLDAAFHVLRYLKGTINKRPFLLKYFHP